MVDDEAEKNCIEAPVENVDSDISMMVTLTNSFSISHYLVYKAFSHS